METIVSLLLTVFATLIAVPVIVFLVEIVAAIALPRQEFFASLGHGIRGHRAGPQ